MAGLTACVSVIDSDTYTDTYTDKVPFDCQTQTDRYAVRCEERVKGSKGQGWRGAARTQRNPTSGYRPQGTSQSRFEERRPLATR